MGNVRHSRCLQAVIRQLAFHPLPRESTVKAALQACAWLLVVSINCGKAFLPDALIAAALLA